MMVDINHQSVDQTLDGGASAPTISVTGTASATVEPTVAVLSVGVSEQNSSLQQARRSVTTKLATARRQLEAVGVTDRDIQTSGLAVHPIHEPIHDHRRPLPGERAGRRFHVSNTMTVVFRDGLDRPKPPSTGFSRP